MAKDQKSPESADNDARAAGAAPGAASPPSSFVAAPAVSANEITPELLRSLPPHVQAIVVEAQRAAQQSQQAADEGAIAQPYDSSDGITYRPPNIPLHRMGEVLIGNWIGRVGPKSVRIIHGCPLRGLPMPVIAAVRATPAQQIGVVAPPAPKPQQFAAV